jgi:class 3 adenylate cyclase
MSQERVERRLEAIMFADVVGYSRLTGEDEVGTWSAPGLRRHFGVYEGHRDSGQAVVG